MFGLGWNELFFIAVLAVVVVGPDRLPEMMRFLGRQYGKLRRASDELRRAFMFEADKVDQEKRLDELRKRRAQARKRADEIRRRALEAKGSQPDLSGIDPAGDKPDAVPVVSGSASKPAPAKAPEAAPSPAAPESAAEGPQPARPAHADVAVAAAPTPSLPAAAEDSA